MSTVKEVLLTSTEQMSEKLDIPFDQAADIIRRHEVVADVVLRGLSQDALTIAGKLRESYSLDWSSMGALYVAVCEGIALGSLT